MNETGSSMPSTPENIEFEKLRLEQARYKADILKWVVVAIGAVISFAVIDYGKLRLEQFRATAENQRELLKAYLNATDAPEPDVWKRKLSLILNSTNDKRTIDWAKKELEYIENFAALDALYRETLKVSSQLVEPSRLDHPQRALARARYNQLYWADLPYAGESPEVIDAMVKFRRQLLDAENAGEEAQAEWEALNLLLINLSTALRNSTPEYSPVPSPIAPEN